MDFTVRRATYDDKSDWLRMRHELWPEAPMDYLALDLDDRLGNPDYVVFVASNEDGKLLAFLEAGIRSHCEGCETSPIGYIEAWYVDQHIRGQKLGRELVHAAENWAREKGCVEMASDTWLENEAAVAVHLKLGYYEVGRLVHFIKRL